MAVTCGHGYQGNTTETSANLSFPLKIILMKMYNFEESLLVGTMPRNIGLKKSGQFPVSIQIQHNRFLCECLTLALLLP